VAITDQDHQLRKTLWGTRGQCIQVDEAEDCGGREASRFGGR
jgi:hypothetical protein